jgi:dephospho-CoA kinase
MVVQPGQPALEEIRARFGNSLIQPDGQLDRAALRSRAFEDSSLREELERILHPRIYDELRTRLSALNAPYCIVAIPLLVEKNWRGLVDRVLVVDAPEEEQIRRAGARTGMDAEQARRILASQASRDERLAAADDIIVNDGDVQRLYPLVERLHKLYTELAAGA